jgi:hypothetical protein
MMRIVFRCLDTSRWLPWCQLCTVVEDMFGNGMILFIVTKQWTGENS